jgi:alpha-mannosidase
MWWEQQTDAVKDSVQFLVANKQLNFANGGWCMHDEATTHYMEMIDQTTLGHSFLKKELGVIPTVGWQLDPFGHSATQASLLTSKVGFDALYFGRIDYQDLRMHQLEKECEGLWNSSRSWNDTTVFWGLTGSNGGNYGSPSGSCFDINCHDPLYVIGMNSSQLTKSMKYFLRKI